MRVAPASAVGTDLWFAAITKVVATSTHHRDKLVDWQIVRRLWLGSLPFSAITMTCIKWGFLPAGGHPFLKRTIAIAVIVTALGMLLQKELHEWGRRLRTARPDRFRAWQSPLTVTAGAILGILVTLTSVGAGALGVVILSHLYPFRLNSSSLIATDIAHAIPLAVFAGLGHILIGDVRLALLGYLLLGSVPMVWVGAKLSSRMAQPLLRWILIVVLLVVGIKLWA